MSPQTNTLEHGTLLLERVIVALAAAEPVPKILVVDVPAVLVMGLFGVNAFLIRLGVHPKGAGAVRRKARRSAVACKVALVEDLDESVFTVTLDRAGIADAGGGLVGGGGIGRRRVAGQAGEDALSERSQYVRAGVEGL